MSQFSYDLGESYWRATFRLFFVKDMNPRKRLPKENDLTVFKRASKLERNIVKIAQSYEESEPETIVRGSRCPCHVDDISVDAAVRGIEFQVVHC